MLAVTATVSDSTACIKFGRGRVNASTKLKPHRRKDPACHPPTGKPCWLLLDTADVNTGMGRHRLSPFRGPQVPTKHTAGGRGGAEEGRRGAQQGDSRKRQDSFKCTPSSPTHEARHAPSAQCPRTAPHRRASCPPLKRRRSSCARSVGVGGGEVSCVHTRCDAALQCVHSIPVHACLSSGGAHLPENRHTPAVPRPATADGYLQVEGGLLHQLLFGTPSAAVVRGGRGLGGAAHLQPGAGPKLTSPEGPSQSGKSAGCGSCSRAVGARQGQRQSWRGVLLVRAGVRV